MSADSKQPPSPPHSVADHALGALAGHVHGEGEDHDHEHDTDGELLGADSQELAAVPLLSMGIDVGSSGTQIVFSRLLMRGPGDPIALRLRRVRLAVV